MRRSAVALFLVLICRGAHLILRRGGAEPEEDIVEELVRRLILVSMIMQKNL